MGPRWARSPIDPHGWKVNAAPPRPQKNFEPSTTRRSKTRAFRKRIVREVYHLDPDDPMILIPCMFCGDQRPWTALTSEHMIPLGAGGTNAMSNMRLSCATCNQRRDEHHRSCYRCAERAVCIWSLYFRLPRKTCSRGNMYCLLGKERVYALRNSITFDLRDMLRSGRSFLRVPAADIQHSWRLPPRWREFTNEIRKVEVALYDNRRD